VIQLGYDISDDHIKTITAKIKQMGDIRPLAIDDTDSIIHAYNVQLREEAAAKAA